MSKGVFYFLSFTWGLPMSLIGGIVGLIFTIFGKRAEKWGHCWCFEVGDNWGGINLGPVFFIQKGAGAKLKNHEYGHAIQNCYYGLLTLFIVGIPSLVRYWYREFRYWINNPCRTGYYDIWFEAQASRLGDKVHSKTR